VPPQQPRAQFPQRRDVDGRNVASVLWPGPVTPGRFVGDVVAAVAGPHGYAACALSLVDANTVSGGRYAPHIRPRAPQCDHESIAGSRRFRRLLRHLGDSRLSAASGVRTVQEDNQTVRRA